MDKIIKNVLNKIEENGFSAYVVGGYVRDYLLGKKSLDVDICTNALPKDLHQIFPGNNNSNNYGGFNLRIKNYNIDITTFRKEISYENRRPVEVEYINSLEEDIKRRDFTINSICMDKTEKIIDLVDGIKDLNNCVIKMNGDIKRRLEEDPLRILRAIRFASILNFKLDQELEKSIKENSQIINNLSKTRIKQELDKILLNKNFKVGLGLLKKLNLLEILKLDYNEDIVYVSDLCGMWAQIDWNVNYTFTKQENLNIINIRKIIKEGIIDNFTLYNFGLYNSLVAAEILAINKKEITKKYNKLPIYNEKDIKISNEEIIKLLNIKPSKIIKEVKQELIEAILSNKLKNHNGEIKKFILKREG